MHRTIDIFVGCEASSNEQRCGRNHASACIKSRTKFIFIHSTIFVCCSRRFYIMPSLMWSFSWLEHCPLPSPNSRILFHYILLRLSPRPDFPNQILRSKIAYARFICVFWWYTPGRIESIWLGATKNQYFRHHSAKKLELLWICSLSLCVLPSSARPLSNGYNNKHMNWIA